MKAFIIAADSVTPDYILNKSELFPTLAQLINKGASASHSAYVQKGYAGSYSSEQNWASLYTGLEPKEHGINTRNVRGENRRPQMKDFDDLQPFWKLLNANGFTVGLWAASNCVLPVPINGYSVSCKTDFLETPVTNREAPRMIQLCEKDKDISKFLDGNPPPRLFPRTLQQQGYVFDQLKQNLDLAEEAIKNYHFQDSLSNFEEELDYWFSCMKRVQYANPVDVLYFFTPTPDIIAHFCLHNDDNPILITAYQMLDRYIGNFLCEFNPEITIFFSDHGQQNFKELVKCSDPEVQREAFSARDDVLWFKNGYTAFLGRNGALLFTAHSLKGVFIVCGDGIKHTFINEMRNLDIYPTLLEMFNIKVPDGRSGFVADIFDKPVINSGKLLKPTEIEYTSIVLLQTHEMSIMDIILNELYLEKRFAKITIAGEAKYEEIFRNNPRVSDFVPIEKINHKDFDEVYCGFFNKATSQMSHIRVI